MEIFNIITMLTPHDAWLLLTAIGGALFLFDDFFVDVMAFFKGLSPKVISDSELRAMEALPEKKVAIIVANWKESDILEKAVNGNIKNIEYKNYQMFLGVYPNDIETIEGAKRAAQINKNVTVVINSFEGPTSKGQMLNEIVREIEIQNTKGAAFDIVLIQDSEDVIHRKSLKLLNKLSDSYDYVQLPVFSLPVKLTQFVAGVYIDEFTESHTKDILLREELKGGIPSAGVGTALSWNLMKKLLEHQNGKFLKEDTLTEDYHLGLFCNEMKIKSHFACHYLETKDENNKKVLEYIATREYFPQKAKASIRQKTRWIIGISLQGLENLKWKSTGFFGTYFLWRDRKALFGGPLFLSAITLLIYFLYTWWTTGLWPALDYTPYNEILVNLMLANFLLSIFRAIRRMMLVYNVYTLKMALLVPVRWIVANLINNISAFSAIYKYIVSKITGSAPKWVKTEHMVPADFGYEVTSARAVKRENS